MILKLNGECLEQNSDLKGLVTWNMTKNLQPRKNVFALWLTVGVQSVRNNGELDLVLFNTKPRRVRTHAMAQFKQLNL